MKFNEKKFFDEYRKRFGAISPYQLQGVKTLLWGFETYYGWWDFMPQIANALAQIYHETAHSFLPVVEGYYLGSRKGKSAAQYYAGDSTWVRNFQKRLRYYPYYGMGHIQLTWRENFVKLTREVRKHFAELVKDFERRSGQTFDLEKYPRQMLDAKISFAVMTVGMHKGIFRSGRTLDRYINPARVNHYRARDIVNGDMNYRAKHSPVKGETIGGMVARYARNFEKCLEVSVIVGDAAKDVGESHLWMDKDAVEVEAREVDPDGDAVADNPLDLIEDPDERLDDDLDVENIADTISEDSENHNQTSEPDSESGSLATSYIENATSAAHTAQSYATQASDAATSAQDALAKAQNALGSTRDAVFGGGQGEVGNAILKEKQSKKSLVQVAINKVGGWALILIGIFVDYWYVILAGVLLVVIAAIIYDRSKKRADERESKKMDIASDRNAINVVKVEPSKYNDVVEAAAITRLLDNKKSETDVKAEIEISGEIEDVTLRGVSGDLGGLTNYE